MPEAADTGRKQPASSGWLDLYFVPPPVAVSALDGDFSLVARVRDQATGG